MQKLSEQETVKLTMLYKEHSCLWDIHSDEHKNQLIRRRALQAISDEMNMEGMTANAVKQKLKTIRSTYYLELNKIEKSLRQDSIVYKPKVKWFDVMHSFVQNVAVKRKPQDKHDGHESESPSLSPKAKRRNSTLERAKLSEHATQLTTISNNLMDIQRRLTFNTQPPEDEFDVFGRHVAMQLKSLSTAQAILGQQNIQNILTECRLKELQNCTMGQHDIRVHTTYEQSED